MPLRGPTRPQDAPGTLAIPSPALGPGSAALARLLGLSASYLNQLEQNRRPLTMPVLLRLSEAFGVEAASFSDDEEARMVAALREVAATLPACTADALIEALRVATGQAATALEPLTA